MNAIIKIFRSFIFSVVAIIIGFTGCATGRRTEDSSDFDKRCIDLDLYVMEKILSNDGSFVGVEVDDSCVLVTTPQIETVVQMGTAALPSLIRIMKCDSLSFDAFTRSWSTSMQILEQVDPKIDLLWYGGATTEKGLGGVRIFPAGQMDAYHFRHEVAQDVINECGRLGIIMAQGDAMEKIRQKGPGLVGQRDFPKKNGVSNSVPGPD